MTRSGICTIGPGDRFPSDWTLVYDDIESWQVKGYPVQATWFPADDVTPAEPGDVARHVVVSVYARGEQDNLRANPRAARMIAEGCGDTLHDAVARISPVGVLREPDPVQPDLDPPF